MDSELNKNDGVWVYDILKVVHETAHKIELLFKGHQDGKLITVLPCQPCLVEHQGLAKSKVDTTYCRPTQYYLPGEGWVCSIGPHWIIKQLAATIQVHIYGIPAEKYWKTKFQLLVMLWHSIDWQDLGQATINWVWLCSNGQLKMHIGFLWAWQEHV